MSEEEHAGSKWPLGRSAGEQEQAALRAALAELNPGGSRPYYDVAADRAAADRYYADVALDQLAELVTRTHRETPRYQPAVELYPWVDLHPDRSLRSLYTGQRYDAVELIGDDFHIVEQRRAEHIRLAAERTDLDDAAVADLVERMLPFNCEHVVPQSWFAKREPMRGDLLHLFACDSLCNSFRGNTPYAEFTDFPFAEKVARSDCGKSEHNGFEPAHGSARRPVPCSTSCSATPTPSARPSCHRTGAMCCCTGTTKNRCRCGNRHRNAAIFVRQGNRNPCIDHPEWVGEFLTPLSTR